MSKILDFLSSIFGISFFNSGHVDDYVQENNKNSVIKDQESTEIGVKFKNDNQRLIDEWKKLESKNTDLRRLVEDLNAFSEKNFKKRITITMIYRTQSEQDYLYRNSERYKKKKFKSPHQFWHAVDIRSRNFTEEEIHKLVNYINSKYDSTNYYKWSSKNHTVGHGMHFHIQFIKK